MFDSVQQIYDENRGARNSYETTKMNKNYDNPRDKHMKPKEML